MLSSETVAAISKHAQDEYPAECCGIVTGMGSTQRVHRCRNQQDELHAQDPETHPRTSREAYDIDRNEMERIFSDAAAANENVVAFYHSHIDCGAYFSEMDREVQTVFGEPEFPSALHVVVAVYAGKVAAIKGFLWNGKKEDFIDMQVE
ncbi:MAG: hypothetical protein A2X56_11415 [Nitrospirae bacterium GWC2_57_13]|nr:MAG: hypothetical protein A2X56_11415 [Nitrospirae bacterium GWC2_57_13]OGW42537.1 MAG: hypothetical protein A2X57_01545 [Nitrospirae bacterium GWD2_57_8]HAS55595.1 hypothetical protein [Nitrospiraceae bacterium]